MRIRRGKPVLDAIAAIGIIGLLLAIGYGYWIGREEVNRRERLSYYAPDVLRQKAVCETFKAIYSRTGRLIENLSEFEQTAYYPFVEAYGRSFYGGKLTFTVRLNRPGKIECIGVGTQDEAPRSMSFGADPPEVLTRRMATAYTSGVQPTLSRTNSIRAMFQQRHKAAMELYKSRYGAEPLALTPRVLPAQPFGSRYPENAKELSRYVQWLRAIEGVSELLDAWRRPLVFSLQNQRMSCRSRGADGIMQSGDDIVVSVAVKEIPSSGT